MKRYLYLLIVGMLLSACTAPSSASSLRTQLTVAESLAQSDMPGFLRADVPRQFHFPADHGPHPGYAVEWWYVTGNLSDADGHQYGYQFTIFRSSLRPPQPTHADVSAWQSNDAYMGHLALTDVRAQRFYAYERFNRGAVGLAGAQATPLRVWIDDWQIVATDDAVTQLSLQARHGDIAIDLMLDMHTPPILQGDAGLSQKSAGNASYYYSMPRLASRGTLTIADRRIEVRGVSWLDREWSTSALSPDQIGWDWFALHLSDGSDIMVYHLRRRDGQFDAYSGGSWRGENGQVVTFGATQLTATPQGSWTSPHTGATYPASWQLTIPPLALTMTVTPLLLDQELPVTVRYWEGAVQVLGMRQGMPISGLGYLEMTGYADGTQQ